VLDSPTHGGCRVGIMRVVARVVEPGQGLELGASLEKPRLRQAVGQLPEEIVVDLEKRLDASIGANNVVREAPAAQMHVRKKTEHGGVVRQSAMHLDAKVGHARRNNEAVVGQLQ